jgi:hypothetical protein
MNLSQKDINELLVILNTALTDADIVMSRLKEQEHINTERAYRDTIKKWIHLFSQQVNAPDFTEEEEGDLPYARATFLEIEPEQDEAPDWHAIETQAKADLEAVATDQEAYAFMRKYFAKDLLGRYQQLYRSDRQEMLRSPKEALDNLLSLPPLE